MRLVDLLSSVLLSLKQRPFRTSLTVLGVVIGTMAVVVMMSIGYGMSAALTQQMSNVAMREITIWSAPQQANGQEAPLSAAVVDTVAELPGVEATYGVYAVDLVLKIGRHSTQTTIHGVSPEWFVSREFVYASGGLPTPGGPLSLLYGGRTNEYLFWDEMTGEPIEVDFANNVAKIAIMDPEPEEMFSDEIPTIGRNITATTAGVLREEGDDWSAYSTAIYADQNSLISALQKANPGKPLPNQQSSRVTPSSKNFVFSQISVLAAGPEEALDVVKQLKKQGYEATAEFELIKQTQDQLVIVQTVLGGIGFISLLVAAIGIANTMLMSVYERTKEIGIIKVLGASLADIRRLFLLESASIGFIGGFLGLILSAGISVIINNYAAGFVPDFLGSMATGSSEEPGRVAISLIPLPLALSALIGSTIIGTISGLLPAQRAMKLSPLDAIRGQ